MPLPNLRYSANPQFPGQAQGRATVFGYNDPEDVGVGAPALGNLSTNNDYLHGVAVPKSVLVQQLGKNPADWRTARADVTNIDTLQTLRVPIVDIGPGRIPQNRGVVSDFTAAIDNAFNNQGGDTGQRFHVSIVPGAGPDVLKDPEAFWTEQGRLNQLQPSTSSLSAGTLAGPDVSEMPSYF
jgi:hypothetical protein